MGHFLMDGAHLDYSIFTKGKNRLEIPHETSAYSEDN